jgi:hypothetical protein
MSNVCVSVCKLMVIKSELSQNILPRLKTTNKEPHIECLSAHSKFEPAASLLQIRSVRTVAAETVLYLLSYKIFYARFLNSNSKFNKSKP